MKEAASVCLRGSIQHSVPNLTSFMESRYSWMSSVRRGGIQSKRSSRWSKACRHREGQGLKPPEPVTQRVSHLPHHGARWILSNRQQSLKTKKVNSPASTGSTVEQNYSSRQTQQSNNDSISRRQTKKHKSSSSESFPQTKRSR